MMQILKTFAGALALAGVFSCVALAQFSSGSTGADGPYVADTSGDFDPNNLTATCTTCVSNKVVNAAGDNVFNFTTITINTGVTVRLRASKVRNAPVIWLATGNVTINGTVNLNGDSGYLLDAANQSQIIQNRRPAEPGAGGYYGGLGARGGVGPEAGAGPGGGAAGQNTASNNTCRGGPASAYTPGSTNFGPAPGPTYGNSYLVPLYGGSGGGGGWGGNVNDVGGGGGAGGGAIRIVSSTQIIFGAVVSQSIITANGGATGSVSNGGTFCLGGPGAGGAIHLIAPSITGGNACCNIATVSNGTGTAGAVFSGFVRFNTSSFGVIGAVAGECNGALCAANSFANLFVGPLYNVPPNATLAQPSVTITQVNSVSVSQPPTGSYLNPDVQINTNSPVTVAIAAANIPLGTVVTLRTTSESGGDQSLACNPLTGTLASSTATCTATFPFSVSLATLRATW